MKYEIKITFETSRELPPEEQFGIVGACHTRAEDGRESERKMLVLFSNPKEKQPTWGERPNLDISEVKARLSRRNPTPREQVI